MLKLLIIPLLQVALQLPGAPAEKPPADPLNWPPLPLQQVAPGEQRYVSSRDFVSPVTGEQFSALVLTRTPSGGTKDYDGCPHPAINALAYALVIDPVSGYVDYPETFSRQVPYTSEELAGIIGQPRFNRNSPEGQPWSGAYGWEKFENAAALAQHVRAPDWQVGQWWLQAAWAVRLDLIPGEADFAAELASAVRGLPTSRGSAADLHTPRAVQIARDWGEMIEAAEVENASAALAVAWLYRSRGELPAANDWLRKAVAKGPSLTESALLQYLANSIGLEHEYLGRAREALIKSYDSRELRENQRGAAAFLLGELSRRLGDVGGAKFWYDEAQGKALGLVRPDLLKQQRDIVTLGKLY